MTLLRTEEEADFERYKTIIAYMRNTHKSVLGKTGRRARGPRFYAITRCFECHEIGMTSSAQKPRTRWTCWGCGGCKFPIWSDGQTPDEDDIWEVWAGVQPNKDVQGGHERDTKKAHAEFVRQNGCTVKRTSGHCAWCEEGR